MNHMKPRWVLFWIGLILIPRSVCGQSGRAELFGNITDSENLAVSGAELDLQEKQTHVIRSIATSDNGSFQFFALPPGDYELTVYKNGFQTIHRRDIILRVADRVALDFVMQLANVRQSLEVKTASPLLQTTTGAVSSTLTQKQVTTLPLDGRNFIPLIALNPGVALPPGSTSQPSLFPRINGSRPRTSEYIYDGISVLQPEPGQVAFYPIIDAIEEFRVQSNSYSAEYGRSNGGVIQVATKSGTNQFHGTLFEFFRNEKLNAQNLFATTGTQLPFKRNQYGFVFGGPLQRNKTFLQLNWQGSRLRIGNTQISTVPTSAQRQGSFAVPVFDPATTTQINGAYKRDKFANNTIPEGRIDLAARALLNRYPLPNVFHPDGSEAVANNYRRSGTDRTDQDQFDVRLDRYFGERHRIFGRYSFLRDDSQPTTPLPDGSGNISSGTIGNTLTRGDSAVVEHAWTLSPLAVNQWRFGFTRRGFQRSAMDLGVSASEATGIPNIPAFAFSQALPTFQITGYTQLGPPSNANSDFTTSVTQFVDTFSTLKGRHSLKAGADVRLERLDVLQPPSPTGLFQFSPIFTGGLAPNGAILPGTGASLASFLLGQVNAFNIDVQQEKLKPRATIAEFFLQDDWRISSRFSLNLGLRYTLNFPSTEANDHAAAFNLTTQQLDFLGQNGISRSARRLNWRNLGPRVSVAYRLKDSFVIRSGYGLTWIEQAGITTPFTTPLFPFIQSVGQRSLDNIHPALTLSSGPSVQIMPPNPDSGLGQGVFGVDKNTGSGYAQQWNFTLQKTFGENWSIETGYLGSKITRLGVPDTNLNQLPVSQLALGNALTAQVRNPYYGEIPISSSLGGSTIAQQQLLRPFPRFTTVTLYRNNIGNSTYHSLQAHLERRFAHGLLIGASYTFSKLLDDASSVFNAAILTGPVANFPVADSFNRHLEKDVSSGDIPHVFAVNYVYELPFGKGRAVPLSGWMNWLAGGWQIAGVVRLQSGLPVTVTQANNFNAAFGFGTQRPNRISDPNLPGDERTIGRYFDITAFTLAPQFTLGSSSRNPVRGPGYQTADMMLGKTFNLSERLNTEFRAEVFNLTNTPPLGQPNGLFGTPAFGSITSAFDQRVFELVLKVNF